MEGSMETSAQLTQNCSKKMTLPPEEEKLLSKVLEEQRKYGPVKRKDLVRVLSSMSDSSEICFQMCRRLWQPHYPQKVRMAVAWLVCHPALPEFQAWTRTGLSTQVKFGSCVQGLVDVVFRRSQMEPALYHLENRWAALREFENLRQTAQILIYNAVLRSHQFRSEIENHDRFIFFNKQLKTVVKSSRKKRRRLEKATSDILEIYLPKADSDQDEYEPEIDQDFLAYFIDDNIDERSAQYAPSDNCERDKNNVNWNYGENIMDILWAILQMEVKQCRCSISFKDKKVTACDTCIKIAWRMRHIKCKGLTDLVHLIQCMFQLYPRLHIICKELTENIVSNKEKCYVCSADKTSCHVQDVCLDCARDSKFSNQDYLCHLFLTFICGDLFVDGVLSDIYEYWFDPILVQKRLIQSVASKDKQLHADICGMTSIDIRAKLYHSLYEAQALMSLFVDETSNRLISEYSIGPELYFFPSLFLLATLNRTLIQKLIPCHIFAWDVRQYVGKTQMTQDAELLALKPKEVLKKMFTWVQGTLTVLDEIEKLRLKYVPMQIMANLHRLDRVSDFLAVQDKLVGSLAIQKALKIYLSLFFRIFTDYSRFLPPDHEEDNSKHYLLSINVVEEVDMIMWLRNTFVYLDKYSNHLNDFLARLKDIDSNIQGDFSLDPARLVNQDNDDDHNVEDGILKLINNCMQCEKTLSILNNALFTCEFCKQAKYCSEDCMELNLPVHKLVCDQGSSEFESNNDPLDIESRFISIDVMSYVEARQEMEILVGCEPRIGTNMKIGTMTDTMEVFADVVRDKDLLFLSGYEKDFDDLQEGNKPFELGVSVEEELFDAEKKKQAKTKGKRGTMLDDEEIEFNSIVCAKPMTMGVYEEQQILNCERCSLKKESIAWEIQHKKQCDVEIAGGDCRRCNRERSINPKKAKSHGNDCLLEHDKTLKKWNVVIEGEAKDESYRACQQIIYCHGDILCLFCELREKNLFVNDFYKETEALVSGKEPAKAPSPGMIFLQNAVITEKVYDQIRNCPLCPADQAFHIFIDAIVRRKKELGIENEPNKDFRALELSKIIELDPENSEVEINPDMIEKQPVRKRKHDVMDQVIGSLKNNPNVFKSQAELNKYQTPNIDQVLDSAQKKHCEKRGGGAEKTTCSKIKT